MDVVNRVAAAPPQRRRLAVVLCLCAIPFSGACREEESTGSAAAAEAPRQHWLKDVTTEAGISFEYVTGATGEFRFPEVMGGGVALFDADGDDRLDIYLLNGHAALPATQGSPNHTNVLLNQLPDGTFEDKTTRSGLGDTGYGMGVAVGDLDNDGDLDVYVSNFGPDRLFRNLGNGTFEDVTTASGIQGDGWSTSVAMLDMDADGWLDIYVARYVEVNELKSCSDDLGRPDYCSPNAFYPVHDLLYRNTGHGKFQDASEVLGLKNAANAGLGVAFADLDGRDGPEIFVANDADPNQLWTRSKDSRLLDKAMLRGAALNLEGHAEAGMGVTVFDLDGDARLDVLLTHLRYETHTLYRALPSGRGFMDVTGSSGLGRASLPYTGFGVVATDLELDGDPDLLIANGAVVRGPTHPGVQLAAPWAHYAEPNQVFVNQGDGRFVEDNSHHTRAFREAVEVSRGLAAGDVDNDGDVDFLLGQIAGPARLFLNEFPRAGSWMGLRVWDPRYERDAIGATVVVTLDDDTKMIRVVSSAGSYLSASDLRVHFGIAPDRRVKDTAVIWPDGLIEKFPARMESYSTLRRGEGAVYPQRERS